MPLVEKSWIRVKDLSQSKYTLCYAYLLTLAGVAEKLELISKAEKQQSRQGSMP